MRILKIVAITGLILAMTATARAVSLVYEEGPRIGQQLLPVGGVLPPNMELTIKMGDYTSSTLYAPGSAGGYSGVPFGEATFNAAGYQAGIAAMDLLEAPGAPGRQISGAQGGNPGTGIPAPSVPGQFGNGLEDNWGIARITRIEDQGGSAVWTPAVKGHDLLVIFHGLQDIHISPQAGIFGDVVNGAGFDIDMYNVPFQDLGAGLQTIWNFPGQPPGTGVGGRLPGNIYTGINDAGQVLELSLDSLPGFLNMPGMLGGLAAEHMADFNFNTLTGQGESWVEVTGGASAGLFDFDGFPMPGLPGSSNPLAPNAGILGPQGFDTTADLRIQFSTNPTTVADWTVESDDPVQGYGHVIPEPLTVVGAFLGVCSLGGYLRRRFT